MDSKKEVLVALGTAIGANCIPCFDFIHSKAKEMDVSDNEIRETIEAALKVKKGAAVFMKKEISEVVGNIQEPDISCCEAFDTQGACCGNG